jgi:hypothetical protein
LKQGQIARRSDNLATEQFQWRQQQPAAPHGPVVLSYKVAPRLHRYFGGSGGSDSHLPSHLMNTRQTSVKQESPCT